MFRKTRLRIFMLIASIATLIIALMLSVIYLASSRYSYERDMSLLTSYIDSKEKGPASDNDMPPAKPMHPGDREDHNRMFRLSTFYSVLYNKAGDVIMVDSNGGILYSEQEIIGIADNILTKEKNSGVYGKMPYIVKQVRDVTIVALIDNTVDMDNSSRLFNNSLIVGSIAWAIIMVLAWIFSKRIVNPLEQNDIKQKQFISDAGHELKTPISVISANADLLSLEIGENKWLSNIQYENERMGQLVKQLLELVRAENVLQAKECLNLSLLVAGAVLPFEGVAFENGISIETELQDGIFVNGNSGQLSQLVAILIDNAIEHGQAGKKVSVKLGTSKNQVILSVVNSGQPILEEEKNRLFERFYRTDEARTETDGHYGLGLAIAKAIVSAHGGKISVDCYDGLIEFRVVISKA